jgi:hypothetical protein
MKIKRHNEMHARVAAYVRRHPELTYAEMSKIIGLSLAQISLIARKHGIHRSTGTRLTPELAKILEG